MSTLSREVLRSTIDDGNFKTANRGPAVSLYKP